MWFQILKYGVLIYLKRPFCYLLTQMITSVVILLFFQFMCCWINFSLENLEREKFRSSLQSLLSNTQFVSSKLLDKQFTAVLTPSPQILKLFTADICQLFPKFYSWQYQMHFCSSTSPKVRHLTHWMPPFPAPCGCGISRTHGTSVNKGVHYLQFNAEEPEHT